MISNALKLSLDAARLALGSSIVAGCAGAGSGVEPSGLDRSEPTAVPERSVQAPEPAAVQEPQQEEKPTELPPVTMANTGDMDADILALVQEKVAAVTAKPGDVDAHVELGMTYEANTYWIQAELCYRNALALMPVTDDNEQARTQWLFRLAVVQYKNGDLLESIGNMQVVAGVFKNTAVVQARLGEMLFRTGRIDDSIAAWERAIASEEKSQQGPWPASRVGLAQVKLYQEDAEGALKLLDEALAIDPGFRAAHYQRGIALSDLGRDDEADLAFSLGVNAFVSYPPDPHQLRLNGLERGYNRQMMNIENLVAGGRAQEAVTALEEMRGKRPEDHRVLNLLAKVFSTSGQLDKALETYAESERVAPEDYVAKVESSYVLLNLQRFDEAQAKAQEAIRLAPGIGRNYYYLGLAQYFPSVAMLQQAQDPQQQQQAGQMKQQALASLQAAMGHGCTEPQLFQYISQIYAEMGRMNEMIRFGEEFAKQHTSNPSAHIFLGKVYFTVFSQSQSADDLAKAEQAVKRAQALGPQHPEVQQIGPQILAAIEQAKAALSDPQQGPQLPDKQ
ncbi:MAG: tetratricopeptide repeat protein [bacterium]|nr:tetratricopeptide repeat protein [bacterium]